jgi:hypothetical protein
MRGVHGHDAIQILNSRKQRTGLVSEVKRNVDPPDANQDELI